MQAVRRWPHEPVPNPTETKVTGPNDDAILSIETNIRCRCGGLTYCAAEDGITVYTCTACGEWVATLRHEFADGAEIVEDTQP